MLRSMGRRSDVATIASLYRDIASTLVVSPGDIPAGTAAGGGRVEFVEHDILMLDPRRAAKLARHLVAMKKPPTKKTRRARA
jgi:hypothetical protein